MSVPPSTVVVVEDHPMFRERVAQVIENEPDLQLVGMADHLEAALQIITESQPNLVLVDISLKGASGLVLIREMRARGMKTPVLVLSMHEENLYADRAMRAGANGYITKHRASSEVVLAIRRVLAGGSYLTVDRAGGKAFDGRVETRPAGSMSKLTERELEVFRWLGRGRTTKEIAQEMGLGIASIDTYRARIKEKLKLRNAIELQHSAARWVMETGQDL